MKYDQIEAVLKVTERCNINCTYCYMFNKESDLYLSKPKQIALDTVSLVADFLVRSAQETEAETIRIIFHGGEPMMMKLVDFDELCRVLVEKIAPFAQVQFSMQTNAMLVTDGWVDLFSKYRINVGVSLDGDKQANDMFRLDHVGKSTYNRVLSGVKILFDAADQNKIPPPAVLCVIDPKQSGKKMFDHFVKKIGFTWIDFLLPIDTLDSLPSDADEGVGRYLIEVFDAWNELGDKNITVRFFDNFYTYMTGYIRTSGERVEKARNHLIITIESDGKFGPDDTLRIVSDKYFDFDVRTHSLHEYLEAPEIKAINLASSTPASECLDCAWVKYCVSGASNGRVVNRYSSSSMYNKKSGLCVGLMATYDKLARHLLAIGYSPEKMYQKLSLSKEN